MKTTSEWPDLLLAWYREQGRTYLPWRTARTAYGTWISEIMLQQTQVITVIPYFERFMEHYPSVESLAVADEQELLKLWQGLGYYSRARRLKLGAQQILTEFAGTLPEEVDDLLKIAGIGPYTAGAISSMAFDKRVPAVDGNVLRVYTRLYADPADISLPKTTKKITIAMQALMPETAPGDFNQALMDLGANICTPKLPKCATCPLQNFCQSYAAGTMLDYPVKTKKTKVTAHFFVATAISNHEQHFILEQRGTEGLLANFWHFPLVEVSAEQFRQLQGEEAEADLFAVAEPVVELADEKLLPADVVWQKRFLGAVKHIYSHQKWQVLLLYGRAKNNFEPGRAQQFVDLKTTDLPLPTVQLKLQALLSQSGDNFL